MVKRHLMQWIDLTNKISCPNQNSVGSAVYLLNSDCLLAVSDMPLQGLFIDLLLFVRPVKGESGKGVMRAFGLSALPIDPPVVHGDSIGNLGATGLLSIPATMDEKSVCSYNSKRNYHPGVEDHLGTPAVPLLGKVRCQMCIHMPRLPTCDAIHRVDHGRKIMTLFITFPMVLGLPLLLVP